MPSYQESAQSAGGKLDKVTLAVNFLGKNGKVVFAQVDDQIVKGTASGESARFYPFTVDLQTITNSTCTCGYYLPAKNDGVKSNEKLCTHQIAGLITADNGNVVIQPTEPKQRTPRGRKSKADQPNSDQPSAVHVSQAFKDKVDRLINRAVISTIVDPIIDAWDLGVIPFLVGKPGLGKTVGSSMTVIKIGFDGFETEEGKQSITDADIVGFKKDEQNKIPGVIARTFERARNGEKIVIFIDEFARMVKRTQDIFLPALSPVTPAAARLQGIETDEPCYIVHAPLWGMEWAPCSRIRWVLGANPWGAQFDPAFIDRIYPIDVFYDPNVLKYFDAPIRDAITELWKLSEEGLLPLPMTYRGISKARNANDTGIFTLYLAKLKRLDITAYNTALDCLTGRGLVKLPDNAKQADSDLTV